MKRQAHVLLKANKESALVLESVHSGLSGLPLSLTKEVSGEEVEPESRDMEEAEAELGTATFYSGSRGNAGTQHTVETKTSDTAGKNVNHLLIIVYHLFFHYLVTAVGFLLTHSTGIVYREPRRPDVCAAASSAAYGKEKGHRSPSDCTQTGCLACSVTGEVR